MRALLVVGVAVIALLAPAIAEADNELSLPRPPASLTVPPSGFKLTGNQALALARSQDKVRRVAPAGRPLRGTAQLVGSKYWLLNFYDRARLRAQVKLDGRTGEVAQILSGDELKWPVFALGSHGSYARAVHKLLVVAGLLFLIPFLRWPLRLWHLDLLMILSLGASYAFAETAHLHVSTLLRYATFAYLLPRALILVFRPSERDPGPLSWAPTRVIAGGLAALLAIRYGLDIAYGHVGDIGYDSLFGADQIVKGYELYDPKWHLGSYGPAMFLAYVPFKVLFPFDLSHAQTSGALAAALTWDFATVAVLYAVGRRLRPGAAGHRLGLVLAFAFAACPWSSLVLSQNTNDGFIALLLAVLLLVATSPGARGAVIGVATAAKFAPLILGGLFLRVGRERGRGPALVCAAAVALVAGALIARYLPGGSVRRFWDSTLGFELKRPSPFSLWGLWPATKPVQWVIIAFGAALAAAFMLLPRERTLERVAAGGTALLLVVQLATTNWYFFYFVWILPFALVAILAQAERTPPAAD